MEYRSVIPEKKDSVGFCARLNPSFSSGSSENACHPQTAEYRPSSTSKTLNARSGLISQPHDISFSESQDK
jgi:hypothetical protein